MGARTWRYGLRARMAVSYVLVTAAAVLIVEALLLAWLMPAIVGSDLRTRVQNQAGQDAKVLSLTASKLHVSFPGLSAADLLFTAMKSAADETALAGTLTAGGRDIPIVGHGRGRVHDAPAEVLVTVDGEIVTSSAMGTFAPGDRLNAPVPGLAGGGGTGGTPAGDAVWWMSPVLLQPLDVPAEQKRTDGRRAAGDTGPATPSATPSATVRPRKRVIVREGGASGDGTATPRPERTVASFEPVVPGKGGLALIGYVYVQAPPDLEAGDPILPYVTLPGALVLALVVPVGLVFGLLSTRRLIGRVRRLAEMTAAVAGGDFRPRLPVAGRDEVGRLEDGFNRMTEQLGESVETERRAARIEARQAERSRIARELHDSISQDLFSLSLLAAGMRRAAPESLRGEAESMERTAARTMREMQALLLELRPVALEDAGLVHALEELGRAYETRLGVRVRATLEDVCLSPPCEHAVLRLVQEALGNAVKHADPRIVDVRLRRTGDGDEVTVEVRDDGTGFDAAQVRSRHGMGLTLMRERVEELGGGFTLRSEPGAGTAVIATLPAGAVS